MLKPATYLGEARQTQAIGTIFAHALTNLSTLYPPIEQALSTYRGPALVGWGDKDAFFSVAQGERTARLVNGRFALYADAGHFTPEECTTEIVRDLQSLLAATGTVP